MVSNQLLNFAAFASGKRAGDDEGPAREKSLRRFLLSDRFAGIQAQFFQLETSSRP